MEVTEQDGSVLVTHWPGEQELALSQLAVEKEEDVADVVVDVVAAVVVVVAVVEHAQ